MTGTGTVLGTPAYMAPEQARGEATEASDQFSLCVTAWEALFGVRPFAGGTLRAIFGRVKVGRITRPAGVRVPARIERALRRGLAADPAARFATVGELCAALARRRRRWPWLAAGVVVAVGAAVAIAMTSRGAAPAPAPDCDAPARALDDVWNAGAKDAIARALIAPPGAQPVPVAAELDAYAMRWRSARRAVCEAAARGEQRAETTEQRVACLDARRAALVRTIARAGAAGADPIDVWRAAEALPDAAACTTLVASAAAVPAGQRAQVAALSADLEDLAVRHAMSSTPTPADVAALRARAETIGYPPLVADALTLEALFAIDSADYAGAETLARRAIRVAEEAHADLGRARAATVLAGALVYLGRIDEARGAVDTADGAIARAGGDPDVEGGVARARAIVTGAAGDPAGAAALLRKRLDGLRARLGDDSIVVAEGWLDLSNEYTLAHDEARSAEALHAGQQVYARHGGGLGSAESLELDGLSALQAGEFARAIEHSRSARSRPPARPAIRCAQSRCSRSAWRRRTRSRAARSRRSPRTSRRSACSTRSRPRSATPTATTRCWSGSDRCDRPRRPGRGDRAVARRDRVAGHARRARRHRRAAQPAHPRPRAGRRRPHARRARAARADLARVARDDVGGARAAHGHRGLLPGAGAVGGRRRT